MLFWHFVSLKLERPRSGPGKDLCLRTTLFRTNDCASTLLQRAKIQKNVYLCMGVQMYRYRETP